MKHIQFYFKKFLAPDFIEKCLLNMGTRSMTNIYMQASGFPQVLVAARADEATLFSGNRLGFG